MHSFDDQIVFYVDIRRSNGIRNLRDEVALADLTIGIHVDVSTQQESSLRQRGRQRQPKACLGGLPRSMRNAQRGFADDRRSCISESSIFQTNVQRCVLKSAIGRSYAHRSVKLIGIATVRGHIAILPQIGETYGC